MKRSVRARLPVQFVVLGALTLMGPGCELVTLPEAGEELVVTLDRASYRVGDTVWLQLSNPRPDTVRYRGNLCHEVYRRDEGEAVFVAWSRVGSGVTVHGCPTDAPVRALAPGSSDSTWVPLRPGGPYGPGAHRIAVLGNSHIDGRRHWSPWFEIVP